MCSVRYEEVHRATEQFGTVIAEGTLDFPVYKGDSALLIQYDDSIRGTFDDSSESLLTLSARFLDLLQSGDVLHDDEHEGATADLDRFRADEDVAARAGRVPVLRLERIVLSREVVGEALSDRRLVVHQLDRGKAEPRELVPRVAEAFRRRVVEDLEGEVAGIDEGRLRAWVKELGWEKVLNRAGTTFRKLPDADREGLDADKAVALMLAQPSMIKRPVLDLGDRRLLGFDTSKWDAALTVS